MDENCHVVPVQKNATDAERQFESMAALRIWGMGCPNCAARVRNSLISLKGVIDAEVDHVSGTAQVIYNPALVQTQDLLTAVKQAGGDGRHEYGAQLLGSVLSQR